MRNADAGSGGVLPRRYSDWLKIFVKTANSVPEIDILEKFGSRVKLEINCVGEEEESGYLIDGEKTDSKIFEKMDLLPSNQYKINFACVYGDITQTDKIEYFFETSPSPVSPELKSTRSDQIVLTDNSLYDFEILMENGKVQKFPKIEKSSKGTIFSFENLEPDWEYEFKYREIINDVSSTDWNFISFRTSPAPPKIKITEIGGNYIELAAPKNVRLTIQYNGRDILQMKTIENKESYIFNNLTPNTNYTIFAKRLISSTTSSESSSIKVLTALRPPKIDLPKTVLTSSHFELFWWFDGKSENLQNLEYSIKVVGHGVNSQKYSSEKNLNIYDLKPQTLYKVYIEANYKTKIENELITTKTSQSVQNLKTLPRGPQVEVLEIYSRSIKVKWRPIVDKLLTHYTTEVRKCGNSRIRPVVRTTNQKSYEFRGLLPETRYCCKVYGQLRNGLRTEAGAFEVITAPEMKDMEWLDSSVSDNNTVDSTFKFELLENVDFYKFYLDLSHDYTKEIILKNGNFEIVDNFGFVKIIGLDLKRKYPTKIYAKMLQEKTRTDDATTVLQTPRSKRCYVCNGGSTFDYNSKDPKRGCQNLNTCYQDKDFACMTFTRRENGRHRIIQACKKRDACEIQKKSHNRCYGRFNCIDIECCYGDFCNGV